MTCKLLQRVWSKTFRKDFAQGKAVFTFSAKKDISLSEPREEFLVPESKTGTKKKKARRDPQNLRSCFDDDTWNSGSNFY